jgi:hypothetical protein
VAPPAAAPVAPAPPARPVRTIEPADYGYVPAKDIRTDRADGLEDTEWIKDVIASGDLPRLAAFVGSLPLASERRISAIGRMANNATDDDAWLREWMRREPANSTPVVVYAEALNHTAFSIRTASRAEDVSDDQWKGFFRVLHQVPDACAAATRMNPADPAPWITLLSAGLGLQWSNDEYRALWLEIAARSPHSFTAVHRAWNYWRPRWFGSLDLLDEFVEREVAAAPLGGNVSMSLIQALCDEHRPTDTAERTAFYHSDRMNQALDRGIADAAASASDHPKLSYLRHWLAYLLNLAGRNAESIEQFRAIGGYCGAAPWDRFKNPKQQFTSARVNATLAWEDAGRPAR